MFYSLIQRIVETLLQQYHLNETLSKQFDFFLCPSSQYVKNESALWHS